MIGVYLQTRLSIAVVILSVMVLTRASYSQDDHDSLRPALIDEREEVPQDIGRILFKHLRFRDLPSSREESEKEEESSQYQNYVPWTDELRDEKNEPEDSAVEEVSFPRMRRVLVSKRQRDRALMNNLAELLSDLKGGSGGSTLRMPSLRFG